MIVRLRLIARVDGTRDNGMQVKLFTEVFAFGRDLKNLENQVNEFIAQVENDGGMVLNITFQNASRHDDKQNRTWVLWSVAVLYELSKERKETT